MRFLILALILGLATVASASNNQSGGCTGNCPSSGAPASATATATGGDASALAISGSDARSSSNSGANNAMSFNDSSYYEGDNEGLEKAATKHADGAAPVWSASEAAANPCGDATGVSGQTGIVGGGLATITETCRAYRLQRLQKGAPDAMSTKLAAITHFAGWFPRFVLHVASFGVLN